MQKYLDSPMFQGMLACLGRGCSLAAGVFFVMLLRHETDRMTIIGSCGLAFLGPLYGFLHLVIPTVPALPGTGMAARLWPRIGTPPQPPPPPAPPAWPQSQPPPAGWQPQRQPPPH